MLAWGKKSKGFFSTLKGIITIVASLFTIVTSVLALSGHLASVVSAIVNFLTFPVPLYTPLIVILILLGLGYRILTSPESPSIPIDQFDPNEMDNVDGRAIAVYAMAPVSAEELAGLYQDWCSYASSYEHRTFKYETDRLEQAQCIEFKDNKFLITPKALEFLRKYYPLEVP